MAIESKLGRGPVGRPIGQPEEKKSPAGARVWIAVAVVILLAAGFWWMSQGGGQTSPSTGAAGAYQAVFLDNGQVYFGQFKMGKGEYATLTDVFYLQTGSVGLDQTSNLQLTKLGGEAHGPEDRMLINSDHILFIEDLKGESKIVQAIESYKSKKQ